MRTQNVVIPSESLAFQDGFMTAISREFVGWNIKLPPTEDTVVEFMRNFLAIVGSDQAGGHDCDFEVRWIAGLFAGWLLRK